MGLKQLNGTAHSIAHQFAVSSEYVLAMALDRGVAVIRIDLLSAGITPPEFNIPRNRHLAERAGSTLSRALRKTGLVNVTRGELVVEIDLALARPPKAEECFGDANTLYTVTLGDDAGRSWSGSLRRYDALVAQLDPADRAAEQ